MPGYHRRKSDKGIEGQKTLIGVMVKRGVCTNLVHFAWCVLDGCPRSKCYAYYYLSRVDFYFYTDQARFM